MHNTAYNSTYMYEVVSIHAYRPILTQFTVIMAIDMHKTETHW